MEKTDSTQATSSQDQFSSFFKSSCTGTGSSQPVTVERPSSEVQLNLLRPCENKDYSEGWTKSLKFFPGVTSNIVDDKLVKDVCIMKGDSSVGTVTTQRNKKLGYRLWKEGYVKNVLVKPNVKQDITKYLVKTRVHASMKNIFYDVYVHLEQVTGKIVFSKCHCKAGQCGCCKHVAALLFTLLDYTNMELKSVPSTLTCTQVAQKWHQHSSANMALNHAVKFNDLIFEKAEAGKTKKRYFSGTRVHFCAIPPFALKISEDNLKTLTNNLNVTGKAALFCTAVASKDVQPSTIFDTSNTLRLARSIEAGDLHNNVVESTNIKTVAGMV